jgi:hypothetical protein
MGTGWRSVIRSGCGEGGGTFTVVLAALVIVAALYFGYFKLGDTTSQRSSGVTAIDSSRAVACRSNRQALERALLAWSQMHDGSISTLDAAAAEGIRIPACPEGGRYTLSAGNVRCSLHP